MKKTVIVAALALGVSSVFAQSATTTAPENLVSKSGVAILPEAGDWSIGFNADPFFHYLGTMFSTANTNPDANFLNGMNTIVGKYYINPTTAYRATLRIGMGTTTTNALTETDGQTIPSPAVTVTDAMKTGYHNIVLGAGIEKRMGKTRLQGYYGAEAMIMLSGSDASYTYGNAITATDMTPTRNNFGTNNPAPGVWVTSSNAGSTFGVGARAILGVEYFLFPKISIGAEYDWGVMFQSTGDGSTTYQNWLPAGASGSVESTTVKTGGGSSFGVDTGINTGLTGTGSIVLNLHF